MVPHVAQALSYRVVRNYGSHWAVLAVVTIEQMELLERRVFWVGTEHTLVVEAFYDWVW
jgi:hypothetical protein